MKSKKTIILVIGNFGYSTNKLDGQTIKSRDFFSLLNIHYEKSYDVRILDSSSGVLNFIIENLYYFFLSGRNISNVFILPAQNLLIYYVPFLTFLKRYFKYNLVNVVIGGWLDEFFVSNKKSIRTLKKIDTFFVETQLLKENLINNFNFRRVVVLQNFRIQDFYSLPYNDRKAFVYLGRVNKMKGINTLFDIEKQLAQKGYNFSMDIYGQVDIDFIDELNVLLSQSVGIKFKGQLLPDQITKVLSDYVALLFPTKYYTEGHPGIIEDSRNSGIPIIATNWKYASEFIINYHNGIIVDFDDSLKGFVNALERFYNDSTIMDQMRINVQNHREIYNTQLIKVINKAIR